MKNQKLIFTIGRGLDGKGIIDGRGEAAKNVAESDMMLQDLPFDLPSKVGIFVWEGEIGDTTHGKPPEFSGLIRDANLEDIKHLINA